MIKRAFDLAVALPGLVAIAPIGALVAAAIRLEDGGPVFFRQPRVGKGGRLFRIWKFRTMRVGAEKAGGSLLTVGADPRITRVGGLLRRYKLDEFPQLLNVVTGEMSLVGPRPEVPRYVKLYTDDQRRVLELVPGITDPASIRFRRESELLAASADPEATYVDEIMPEKIRLNLEYTGRASPLGDLRLILETILKILE
jgi:lipopolysaccharide/colanic/teichoic acid biosynthesis glycosyltransferase